MFQLRKTYYLGLLLCLAVLLTTAQPARAEPEIGDIKLAVTGVVKGGRKSTADVLIINKTGQLLPMEADSVAVPVPIDQDMPLQLKPGTKEVKITEYRWSYRGTGTERGWVMRSTKTINVGLGLRGSPAKYVVLKPKAK